MKIKANREPLADALTRAQRAVGTRGSLPVLQGILCEASDGKLWATGTDLEVTVRSQLDVEVLEPGKAILPGRLLTQAVRRMPSGMVTFETVDGSQVKISGETEMPVYMLRQLGEDFPPMSTDTGEGVQVDGEGLAEAIKQVAPSASTDLGRAVLTGVLFESNAKRLRLVATDSYRLALRDLPAIGLSVTGMLPARGLRELPNTVGASKVDVAFTDRQGVFGSAAGVLRLRMIEGNFPKYQDILPAQIPNTFTCDRAALLEAIRRMELVAEGNYPVQLTISQSGAEMRVLRQDVGRVSDHLEGKFEGEGETLSVAFNPRYLSDGVAALSGETVRLRAVDSMKPGYLDDPESDDFLYVLMPVNV